MKVFLFAIAVLCSCTLSIHAFEIDLPPRYREDLEQKRQKEASTLWRELDRAAVESAIREFVAKNPRYDGVPLNVGVEALSWQKKGRSITCGDWHVFLAEWELSYPSLVRIDWRKVRLIVARSYDWKSKVPLEGGNADIRLTFSLDRNGTVFSRRIMPRLESADYGEVVLLLPLPGGVELRKSDS